MQRKRVPIIRRRYTKSSRGKRTLRTGRNSKKVRVSRSQNYIVYIVRLNLPNNMAVLCGVLCMSLSVQITCR